MSGYTPGPWGIEDEVNGHCMVTDGVDSDGSFIYVAEVWREEDIPLIAAAPDMLAALVNVYREVQPVTADMNAWDAVETAIARATEDTR